MDVEKLEFNITREIDFMCSQCHFPLKLRLKKLKNGDLSIDLKGALDDIYKYNNELKTFKFKKGEKLYDI